MLGVRGDLSEGVRLGVRGEEWLELGWWLISKIKDIKLCTYRE